MWGLLFWLGLFIVGFLIIFFSADFFIDNLKDLCLIYGVSSFIVGLLILGIDPEESIASIAAAFNGLPYIALGNVIGNSIISLSLCFALPAFFYKIDLKSVSRFYFLILYTCMGAILFSFFIQFGLFIFGLIAIVIYLIYFFRSLRYAKKVREIKIIDLKEFIKEIHEIEEFKVSNKKRKILLVCLGLILIFLGGELLIFSTVQIMVLTGFSEAFFGFIIIAFITNVEELTLIFKSIKKGSIEIGLGGMVGKLIWNLSFSFGVSGVIALSINFTSILLLNWLILLGLIIFYQVKSMTKSLNKKDGIILIFFLLFFLILNIAGIRN